MITTTPPTVDGIQLTHTVGEPQPSPTVVETFEAASPAITVTKNVHKAHSFTSSRVDSPV